MQFVLEHSYLIPLLPLIGAAIAGFFGARYLKGQSHWPIWIGVLVSAVMAIVLLAGMAGEHGAEPIEYTWTWFNWIRIGDFNVDAAAFLDQLTAVMLCVVCGIGFLI